MVVKRKLPFNYDVKDHSVFKNNLIHQTYTSYLYSIDNIKITNKVHKGLGLKNFKITRATLPGKGHENDISNGFILYNYLKPHPVTIDETCLLIYDYWGHGYFHWILDSIPRLLTVINYIDNYQLLFPEEWLEDNFHYAALKPFNVKNFYFIPKNSSIIKIKNLVISGHTASSGNYNVKIINEMRLLYLTYFKSQLNLNLGEKIYITRKNAPKRKIINESEVIDYLTKYGFKTVDFQDYDFVEKISIASKAKIIVSVHGAGLTNVLFMQKNGYVLELIHNEMKVLAYYYLADSLNFNYLYQKCEPINNLKSFFTSDIKVDLKELEKNISLILKNVNYNL